MSEKLSIQALNDIFAKKHNLPRKTAESFARNFFETIEEGLKTDGIVKVAGLGTFKVVEVASRESVNVNSGERFVIEGYKKVTFERDDSLALSSVEKQEESVEEAENVESSELSVESAEEIVADNVESSALSVKSSEKVAKEVDGVDEVKEEVESSELNEASSENTLDTYTEPIEIEKPIDEFSGIDMKIITPESLNDISSQVEQARLHADATMAAAQKAHDEYARLASMLDRFQHNPEMPRPMPAIQPFPIVEPVEVEKPQTEDAQLPTEVTTDVESSEPTVQPQVQDAQAQPETPTESATEEQTPSEATPAKSTSTEPLPAPQKKYTPYGEKVNIIDIEHKKPSKWRWLLYAILLLLFCVGAYIGFSLAQDSQNKEKEFYQQRYTGGTRSLSDD